MAPMAMAGPDAAAGTGRLDADRTGRLQQQRGFTKGVACRQLGHHLLIACRDHPSPGWAWHMAYEKWSQKTM